MAFFPSHYGPLSALLFASSAALAGCSSSTGEQGRNRRPATAVAVVPAERQNLSRTVTLTGPVEPIRVIGVNSQASGTILAVRVTEGDRVRPGQLLAELDARETVAQLERARAVLANALTAFERSEAMQKAGIITDAEFEQARAAFATATSDVKLWETRLEFSRVTAPSAGVITSKAVETGSAVSTNQRLFDIADDALLIRYRSASMPSPEHACGDGSAGSSRAPTRQPGSSPLKSDSLVLRRLFAFSQAFWRAPSSASSGAAASWLYQPAPSAPPPAATSYSLSRTTHCSAVPS